MRWTCIDFTVFIPMSSDWLNFHYYVSTSNADAGWYHECETQICNSDNTIYIMAHKALNLNSFQLTFSPNHSDTDHFICLSPSVNPIFFSMFFVAANFHIDYYTEMNILDSFQLTAFTVIDFLIAALFHHTEHFINNRSSFEAFTEF